MRPRDWLRRGGLFNRWFGRGWRRRRVRHGLRLRRRQLSARHRLRTGHLLVHAAELTGPVQATERRPYMFPPFLPEVDRLTHRAAIPCLADVGSERTVVAPRTISARSETRSRCLRIDWSEPLQPGDFEWETFDDLLIGNFMSSTLHGYSRRTRCTRTSRRTWRSTVTMGGPGRRTSWPRTSRITESRADRLPAPPVRCRLPPTDSAVDCGLPPSHPRDGFADFQDGEGGVLGGTPVRLIAAHRRPPPAG
jgi:hypothetical protein